MSTLVNTKNENTPSTFSLLIDAAKDLPEKILQDELIRITKVKAILNALNITNKVSFNAITNIEIEKILQEIDNGD